VVTVRFQRPLRPKARPTAPKGLWGMVYWYSLYLIHQVIFAGMIRKIAERAALLAAAGRA